MLIKNYNILVKYMCDFNNKSCCSSESDKNQELNYCNESSNKNCEFLKPLSMDKLFSTSQCNDYTSALNKAKKIRNAFFAAKASLKNYVNNVEDILSELCVDLSDNEIELDSVRKNYYQAVSNLNSSLYASFKVNFKDENLINLSSYNVTDNFDRNIVLQKSKPFILDIKGENNENDLVTLTHVSGISIEHNEDSKVSKLYFNEPKINENLSQKCNNKRIVDETQIFITTPSIKCFNDILSIMDLETTYDNDEDNLMNIEGNNNDAFNNLDLVIDFLEEIQNYQDNTILDDNNVCNNQILQSMNHLDQNIKKFENTHKYIVQLCKINNDTL